MTIFLILILTIIIHEMGHFLVAKLLKYEVPEFAIGFGPKLLSGKFKGTTYSVRLIPLGGYVNIPEEEFLKNTGWKNAVVLISGAFFNFIGAVAGFIILSILTMEGLGILGTVQSSIGNTGLMVREVVVAFVDLFSGGFRSIVESTVSPIGFVSQGTEMVKSGADFPKQVVIAVKLFILLNINLGVFNLIPIPILDGFKILLEIVRGITKRPLDRFEIWASGAGLLFLGAIFITTIGKDIINIVQF